jgi:hypothetical protein
VFQCTCGSAVLFEQLGGSWPKHECAALGGAGGIGGSGYSGWTAIDVLRSQGVAITPEITNKIFGTGKSPKGSGPPDTKKIMPSDGKKDLIGVVREVHTLTKNIKVLDELGSVGHALLGISKLGKLAQITVVSTNVRPNESFTFIIGLQKLDKSITKGQYVMAHLNGKVAGKHAIWIGEELNPL